MIYVYHCEGCGKSYEIAKPVAQYDEPEYCSVSGTTMVRAITPVRLHLYGTQVQEKKWQPAVGKAMTDSEMRQYAKSRDWIEVGNENLDKYCKPTQSEYPTFTDDDVRAITAKP